MVDGQGLPVRLLLTPGQASDKTTAPALLGGLRLARNVIADRGYDAKSIVALIQAGGAKAHIPTQSNVKLRRSVDLALYRQRNLVERFFNKIKHFRRIATRYDKLAANYMAMVKLASIRVWLRAYKSTA